MDSEVCCRHADSFALAISGPPVSPTLRLLFVGLGRFPSNNQWFSIVVEANGLQYSLGAVGFLLLYVL